MAISTLNCCVAATVPTLSLKRCPSRCSGQGTSTRALKFQTTSSDGTRRLATLPLYLSSYTLYSRYTYIVSYFFLNYKNFLSFNFGDCNFCTIKNPVSLTKNWVEDDFMQLYLLQENVLYANWQDRSELQDDP